MANEHTDPHPSGPRRFVGLCISFDHTDAGASRRLVGTVEQATFVGRTARGSIPDYSLVVRGKSGRALTVSLVESRASIIDPHEIPTETPR